MKKYIRMLADKPIIGVFIRRFIFHSANKAAESIADHFSKYLSPKIAYSHEVKQNVFQIRHGVYCEELKFEPIQESGLEKDEFDEYSLFCLIKHKPSQTYAGTVRLVAPRNTGLLLPIEKFCSDSINTDGYHPQQFNRNEICEISRLAVPAQFRRRNSDKFKGAAEGQINIKSYSEDELRCFPFIAVGLYMTAASLALKSGITHAFVMMEPRLARGLSFVGINFKRIGPVIDYHGKRAPYYINAQMFLDNLSPGFKALLVEIENEVGKQQVEGTQADTLMDKVGT